jgi:DNA-binding response OmpR family regulator
LTENARRPTRILLVEDYDDAREMYAQMLSLAGHHVETAKNGEEAIEKALSSQFDAVVLDIALPKVDGIAVVKTLRNRTETKSVPIISMSASVGQGVHKMILEAGADLALDKPCLPDELAAAVGTLLDERRRARSPDETAAG